MHYFTKKLLAWHSKNPRHLPWKNTKDPYIIWLSEVILQQTRVAQALPYYHAFTTAFPNVQTLAAAPQDEVLRLWEGLGYYSRARNLHAAAKYVVHELGGRFPTSYAGLKALKGVGDYTAAAIASFAYNLPHAVVDGNVYRVLARYFNIAIPKDTTAGKKHFAQLANELLPPQQPAAFNQAIMDFGALVCTPKKPACTTCPLADTCLAKQQNTVFSLPVKAKKLTKKHRFFTFLVIKDPKNEMLLEKRLEKDIWQGLYQFPLIEAPRLLSSIEVSKNALYQQLLQGVPHSISGVSIVYKQQLTHQTIHAQFIRISAEAPLLAATQKNYIRLSKTDLAAIALPKVVNVYLADRQASLPL